MDVIKKENGSNLTVAVVGRLDTTTAPQLEGELKASFASCEEMELDFSDLEYISSAGLRVVLAAHKAMNAKGGLKVTHVKPDIMEVFEITGFSDILTIE